MKKLFYLMSVLVIIFGLTVTAYAISFSDNFNDGNTDGWTLNSRGDWSVVNGTLWENYGGEKPGGNDDCIGLVNNRVFSHEIIETKVLTYSSYVGVTLWYQGDTMNFTNMLTVLQYLNWIYIMETIDGVTYRTIQTYTPLVTGEWHDLKVDANSSSGKVKIYIDGILAETYDSLMPKEERIGQSGIYAGNAGGYWDDFSVKSVGKSVCVPEPSTMLLLGLGLIGLAGARRKFKK